MALLCLKTAKQLPSKGTQLGDVYYVSDSRTTYFVVSDLSLLCINDLLSGAVPHVRSVGPQGEQGIPGRDGIGINGKDGRDGKDSNVPGPPGERGRDGLSIIGPKGDRGRDSTVQGAPGRDGRDGKDSVIPGPIGASGPQGPRGDVLILGESEQADALRKLRAKEAKWQAAWLMELDRNASRRHAGLKSAIDSVLKTLKQNAEL